MMMALYCALGDLATANWDLIPSCSAWPTLNLLDFVAHKFALGFCTTAMCEVAVLCSG